MKLQKLIHSKDDFMEDGCENAVVIHGVNEIMRGGEYTICGRAIPDSSLKYDGWEAVGEIFTGNISKCECKDCLKTIKYYKSLK